MRRNKVTLSFLLVLLLMMISMNGMAMDYNQAPILDEMVSEGELPTVDERLPEDPLILTPTDETGKYGGTTTVSYTQISDAQDVGSVTGAETILRIARDGATIKPNIAEDWEWDSDYKELTLYLREGIKWSDGEPFTADDIMFWYEGVLLNEELTPVPPSHVEVGGEVIEIEKINDYTIKINFDKPNPAFEGVLAHNGGNQGNFYLPKHYLEKYHPDYTSEEEIEELLEKHGYDSWYDMFDGVSECYYANMETDVGFPTLRAFYIDSSAEGYTELKRNPYYWKVDPEGNQLPYIDNIRANLVESVEVHELQVMSGDIDFSGFSLSFGNYPIYRRNEEEGNYRTFLWDLAWPLIVEFYPNHTHEDPVKREVFQNTKFKRALSLGLNREEMNEVVFMDQAEPYQLHVTPEDSSYYFEEFAKTDIEYDPEKANALLDEMGMEERDDDGYRLAPNGERFSFTIEFTPAAAGESKLEIVELAQDYWTDLDLNVDFEQIDRTLYFERDEANRLDMGLWHTGQMSEVRWIQIGDPFVRSGTFAPRWLTWVNTKGEEGKEPSEDFKKVFELWEDFQTEVDEEKRIEMAKNIFELNTKNRWTIGTLGGAPQPIIINKNLKNVPEEGLWSWDFFFGALYRPEQYYYDN